MMIRKMSALIIYPLLIIFLMTTTGFSVFRHHCHSSGEVFYSVFSPVGCDHSQYTELKTGHCCNQNNDIHFEIPADSCSKCCSDEHVFLKSEIYSVAGNFLIIDFQPRVVETHVSDLRVHFTFFADILDSFHCYQPKPPPKTGTFKVILYNSLKIPEFLS